MTAQQLKNSILQLAVQGKLVPQDPNDEPASVLLERIRAEKEALIKAKKIKREKNPSVIFRGADNTPYEKIGNETVDFEAPFEIPDTWVWVRLREVCQLLDGEKRKDEFHTVMDAKFLRGKSSSLSVDSGKYVSSGDLMILVDGENSGEVFVAPIDGYMGSTFKNLWIAPGLYIDYVLMFIDLYRLPLKNSKVGAAIPHLNKELFFGLLLPVPPYAEQEKIVKQYNALIPYIENYDASETNLNKLNTSFPEQLKKSILQWAVQGKLVPQDPTDEPAEILLERIRGEKERLVREGKIKKDKHESVIFRRDNSHYEKYGSRIDCIDDEIPFEIPQNWSWVRLLSIVEEKPSNGFSPPGVDYSTLVKNLTLTATTSGVFKPSAYKYVDITPDQASKYWLQKNDILIQRSNSRELVGTSCIYTGEDKEFIYPDLMMRIRLLPHINVKYIDFVLKSPFVRKYYSTSASGTSDSMPKINQSIVSRTLIPLPPINEQNRIVELLLKAFN